MITAGYAQPERDRRFAVDFGPTSVVESLRRLQRETGARLVFSPSQIGTLQAHEVKGTLTVREILDRLTEGSGLQVRTDGRGTYVIVADPDSMTARRDGQDTLAHRPDRRQRAARRAPAGGQFDEPVGGLPEVIVNARRIEENLQNVPIAVTAFSAPQLQRQDIRDIMTLTKDIGGLNVCCTPSNVTFLSLRGMQGVVAYFADAPTGQSGFGNFFDVQSVQVLKGPQGTLFGIASNGGAVLLRPRMPTDTFEGYVSAVAGNLGRRTLEGAVNVPVIEDKVLLRAGMQASHTDGYVQDITTGKKSGDENYVVGRLSAIIRITDALENYTVFQYYKSKETPRVNLLTYINPNGPALAIFGQSLIDALNTQTALGKSKFNGLSVAVNQGGPYSFAQSLNVVNTTTWNITDTVLLKNILGWQRLRSLVRADTDGTPLPMNEGHALNIAGPGTFSWSDEVQLQGSVIDERLKFTIGTIHSGLWNNPTTTYAVSQGDTTATINKISALTRAVYGQGTYNFSDYGLEKLSFTAGYRYTWDTRRQRNVRLTVPTLEPNRDLAGIGRFGAGSWTLGLQYQYTPDTMYFLTASKGYSSGGLTLTAPPGFQQYQPESLTNLESGVKSTFMLGDWQVRTNISAFYGFYDNVQVSVSTAVQLNPPPAPASLLLVTQNAAEGRVRGIDADISVVPSDYLELSGTVAYTNNVYTRWNSLDAAGNPRDLSSSAFILTPRLKYTINAVVRLPVDRSIGALSVTANYSHTGRQFVHAIPKAEIGQWGVLRPYAKLDLGFDWRDINGMAGLDGQIFVTNVTKNPTTEGQCGCYLALGFVSYQVAPPRQLGLRLRYEF